MNHDIPPFDDDAREREWQAQEYALRAERLGLDPAAGDARVHRYRVLARALREPMPDALPADFALQMAARVAAPPARRHAADAHFESTLASALAAVLLVAGGAMLAVYGKAWLPALHGLLPSSGSPATGWLLALGGCLGASWLLGLWQRRSQA